MNYTAFFDGAIGPDNPGGEMGCGAIIYGPDKRIVFQQSKTYSPTPLNSNNSAEYLALQIILDWTENNLNKGDGIVVYGDSLLVVNQMNDKWVIKNGLYKNDARLALNTLWNIKKTINISLKWVPREKNIEADMLSRGVSVDPQAFLPNPHTRFDEGVNTSQIS